jgi:hypothetical protein
VSKVPVAAVVITPEALQAGARAPLVDTSVITVDDSAPEM